MKKRAISVQSNIAGRNGFFTSSQRQHLTTGNAHFKKIQRNFSFAAVLIPFLGTLVAVGLLRQTGISLGEVGVLVCMYVLTVLGLEVGFHRYFSHHAFQTTKAVRVILAILGSMAAVGHLIHWVSHHRGHHQCSDQLGDSHSPHLNSQGEPLSGLRGLWHAHSGWFFESDFPNVLLAKDLLRDPALVKVNQLYLFWVILGFAIPTVLGGVLAGTWIGALQGLLWGGFVRVFLVHHAFWSINSICHVYGNRPFNTGDRSANNLWLALPTLGESWHNNHHAFSNSAIVGLKWWQLDPSAWVIRALEAVGLAWDVKAPTAAMIEAKKSGVN